MIQKTLGIKQGDIENIIDNLDLSIERTWAMPNKDTFRIKQIRNFIWKGLIYNGEIDKDTVIIDPFCGTESLAFGFKNGKTNDLNKEIKANSNVDALEFLQGLNTIADCVLFDPPYSPRQITEQYKSVGLNTQNGELTRSSFYSNLKDQIARITKVGGKVFCCGWNSNGLGKERGFLLLRVLIVAHGGAHNDTIITEEIKVRN